MATKKNDNAEANIEAAKTVGRNGVLAALSALITAIANWLIGIITNFDLPTDIVVSLGGLVYAALLYIDKVIHENKDTKLKGIVPF